MWQSNVRAAFNELSTAVHALDPNQIEGFEAQLISARNILCFGMGRSGLNARAFAMRLMHLGFKAHVVGDVTAPPIAEGDLLIIVSASASSYTLNSIFEKAKKYGANIALLTANPHTALYAVSDACVNFLTPTKLDVSEQDGSLLPMGTLFEQCCYLTLDLVVLDLMQKLNITKEDMMKRHANLE